MSIRRICRLEIENFRGVTESRVDVPRSGLKLSGDEGAGKTSHLDAIAAVLRGTDLGVEVIRRGSDKTTLLVGFDDGTTVKRSITAKGVGQPTVTNGDAKIMKPQTWLSERLGLAAFDVISFISAKSAERVRMLQEAVPCTVSLERLREWVPSLEQFDCSGHGLDVVKRLHKIAYDKRTAANAAAKSSTAELERAATDAAKASEGVVANALEPAEAFDLHAAAERHVATLRAAVDAAKAHEARTAGTRERIAKMRDDARGNARTENELIAASTAVDVARNAVADRKARIADLEALLAGARANLTNDENRLQANEQTLRSIEDAQRQTAKLFAQADELAATLASAAPGAPTDEAVSSAHAAVNAAREALEQAQRAESARAAESRRRELAAKAVAASDEAERLDGIVKALSTAAPRALMVESGGIEGLEIDGETIRVDGVAIDSLSSGEQLRLAVRIAKRLNKTPILIVDHLEHLAPGRRDDFLREACAGGWQVFATVVADGGLAIEGLAFEETAAAAE